MVYPAHMVEYPNPLPALLARPQVRRVLAAVPCQELQPWDRQGLEGHPGTCPGTEPAGHIGWFLLRP